MLRRPDPDDPSYRIPAYQAAKEILHWHWDFKLPIRPWEIAQAMGLSLRPRGGPGDTGYASCGAYLVEDRIPIIEYNVTHDMMRKRFAIAHELGHHVFGHRNVPGDVRGFHLDDPDIRERAANRFAFELLIPWDITRGMVRMCKLRSVEAIVAAFQLPESAVIERMLQIDFGY